MRKTVVIDIVGLSNSVIGPHTPFISKYRDHHHHTTIEPNFPAVTTSAQSTYITGVPATEHGIVGNGWYDREYCEINFWKQSDKLVQAEKIWERARQLDPDFTCSKMFWWYNMYSDVEYSATPRPQYHQDGLKLPDCYTQPAGLRDQLQKELGTFPLFKFWGPNTSIDSSQWIADASLIVDKKHDPTLTLIYLPHLDYDLQKYSHLSKEAEKSLLEIDELVRQLVTHYEAAGAHVYLLSEYGINPSDQPIHLNRIFRKNDLIAIREESGRELLDPGASKAFVVADHQIAHVYINDPASAKNVRDLLEKTPGIARILDEEGKKEFGMDHDRAGDLVLISEDDHWFSYYFWEDDRKAPDYARAVQIHKKPGFDPVEMFMAQNPLIKGRAAYKLLRKKLGMRYVMDVISLDATLIKGSHGSPLVSREFHPVLISNRPLPDTQIKAHDVYDVIWNSLGIQEK